MFENTSKGLFKLLDDTCKIQNQNSENFVHHMFASWSNHQILTKPKPKEIQHNIGFKIRHFAGDVVYNAVCVTVFLCSNNIVLSYFSWNFSVTQLLIFTIHLYFQDNFVEKNLDVVPKAINDICQSVNINCPRNGNISHSKSVTYTLKMETAELIRKLNKTVSMHFNSKQCYFVLFTIYSYRLLVIFIGMLIHTLCQT